MTLPNSTINNNTQDNYLNQKSSFVTLNPDFSRENSGNFSLIEITEVYQKLKENPELEYYFLDSDKNPIKVQKIKKTPYTGKIYDVDVPNDIILVRKTGKAVWSGNSNHNDGILYNMSLDGILHNGSVICSGGDCPNWTTGQVGGALQFDGVNDYVDCGNDSSLNVGGGDSTWETWIKSNSVTAEHWSAFLAKAETSPTYDGIVIAENDDDLKIYIDAASPQIDYNGYFTVDDWIHFVVTIDNTAKTFKVYKNGVEVSSSSYTTFSNYDIDLYIGQRGNNDMYFNGTIDEVRIYNRSLSADEILMHYQSEFQKYDSSEWRFYCNVTNLTDGMYSYYGWVNDSAGNSGQSETRTLNVHLDPVLEFQGQTPADNLYLPVNYTTINISVYEPHLDEFRFQWNSTNYTFLADAGNSTAMTIGDDNSLVLAMAFNNMSVVGECYDNETEILTRTEISREELISLIMVSESVEDDSITLQSEKQDETPDFNPFEVAKVVPEILEVVDIIQIDRTNLINLLLDGSEQGRVFSLELSEGSPELGGGFGVHSSSHHRLNSFKVMGFILPDLSSSTTLSVDSMTSLTRDSLTSLLSSSGIPPISMTLFFISSSSTSPSVSENACLAMEDQLTQSTLDIRSFKSSGTDNVIVPTLKTSNYVYYVYPKHINTCSELSEGFCQQDGRFYRQEWKHFRELDGTEKVATLNPENGETEFHLPWRYQNYSSGGSMYRIETEQGDLLVSPGHKVYAVAGGIKSTSNPFSYNVMNFPSKFSGGFSLSSLEKEDIKDSALSCGILNQTTENILSLGNLEKSLKCLSFVINTRCSDLENSASLPFASPLGFEIISTPCCLKNVSNLFFYILVSEKFKPGGGR